VAHLDTQLDSKPDSGRGALDYAALAATPCERDPFDYVICPGFVRKDALAAIHADYPKIDQPGSFPYQTLEYGPAFASVLEGLQGPEMRRAIETVFGIDLEGRPTTVTVRGQCQQKDGRIHPDSSEKIVTVLVYLNPEWEEGGGRLRLLRSDSDIEDYAAEVPPNEGTLLAFVRSDTSFHGHKTYVGPRRVLQLNWVTGDRYAKRERRRHMVSSFFKRLGG
jgi:SM-20-related protein